MQQSATLAATLLSCLCLLLTTVSRVSADLTPQTTAVVPDQKTREKFYHVQVRDIKYIRFYGVHLKRFQNNPLDVNDAELKAELLSALQQAVARPLELANRVDTIEVHFNKRHGKKRLPIILSFNAISSSDAFGVPFYKAVQKLCHHEVEQSH